MSPLRPVLPLLAILALCGSSQTHAIDFTCRQIRQAVRTMPKVVICGYAKTAPAEYVEKAKRCLPKRLHAMCD